MRHVEALGELLQVELQQYGQRQLRRVTWTLVGGLVALRLHDAVLLCGDCAAAVFETHVGSACRRGFQRTHRADSSLGRGVQQACRCGA